MHDRPAAAIEHRAQIVERPAQVQVRHIDVPVLMRLQRLHEPRALLRDRSRPAVQPPRAGEDPIGRRGADRHHVVVQHHERQAAIPLERMPIEVVDDGLPFGLLKPVIPRHQGVVLVGLAVALPPVKNLPAGDPQPAHDPRHCQLCPGAELSHEIHHRVPRVRGNPRARQGSPSAFFSLTYSSDTSAMIASLRASFTSSAAILASSSCSRLGAR